MNAKVLVLIFLLGFVVEYPIYSQEHNGRTYTIKAVSYTHLTLPTKLEV